MILKKIEAIISNLLLLGTIASLIIVTVGGMGYLMQHGKDTIGYYHSFHTGIHPYSSLNQIWQGVLAISPLALVQAGFLVLITTQTIRVALVAWFFANSREYRLTLASVFIFIVLLYSTLWRIT